jgi:hypothetical protein
MLREDAGGAAALVLVGLALTAGCLGLSSDDAGETLEESQAAPGEAQPAAEDELGMTAEESETTDEGTREGTPPFYANRTVTVEGDLRLDELSVLLAAHEGPVEVEPGLEEAYRLEATLTGYGYTPEQARQERDRMELVWSIGEPGARFLEASVEVEPAVDSGPIQIGAGAVDDELVLVLPEELTVQLDATARDGDVRAADLDATVVEAGARDGDVQVADVTAESVAATSRDGDVALGGVEAEVVEAETRDGDVDLDVTAEAVQADTRDGDLDGELVGTGAVEADARDGDVDLEVEPGLDGDVAAEARDGDVTVTVPEGPAFGYHAELATRDGDASVELEDGSTSGTDDGVAFTTSGFDERSVATFVDLETRDGDALLAPS